MNPQIKKFVVVMGLAMGLPSTLVGLFFLLNMLVSAELISWNTLLIVLVSTAALTLGVMVKYVLGRKSKQ